VSAAPIEYVVKFCDIDGELCIDNAGIRLLLGLSEEQAAAMLNLTDMPAEWHQQGRRRSKEAAAHTGSEDLLDILEYWAAKDYVLKAQQ
jgi:hypothetical protein